MIAASIASADGMVREPWTCRQLESATDPFYRMFPAYLGSIKQFDQSEKQLKARQGHCFMNIDISTEYTKTESKNEDTQYLKASVSFDLD